MFSVDGLRSGHQIFAEFVAEVNIDFIETALAITESGKVLIDMLPLAVLLVCLLPEVGEEVTLHLFLVEEIIAFIDNGLVASASECLGFLGHTLVVITLALILGLGKDVDAK
jgi:hypothetical protein